MRSFLRDDPFFEDCFDHGFFSSPFGSAFDAEHRNSNSRGRHPSRRDPFTMMDSMFADMDREMRRTNDTFSSSSSTYTYSSNMGRNQPHVYRKHTVTTASNGIMETQSSEMDSRAGERHTISVSAFTEGEDEYALILIVMTW